MKSLADWVRKTLYSILPLDWYLRILSKLYLIAFRMGLLKNSLEYAYPYFLHKIIKPGEVCIDIGANLGYMTTLYSRLVGKEGKVYAVEPVQPMLNALRANTKGMDNVEILPYALGEENKSIQLGNSSVRKQGFMASGRHEIITANADTDIRFEATMKRGSELFGQLNKIDFIKCDIEGYETVVIPEIKPIITQHRPILLIESRGDDRIMMMQFFRELNFQSFIIEDNRLIPASPDDYLDILIIPEEKLGSFKHLI